MIHLSSNQVNDETTSFVRNWIKLLSQGRFDEAFAQIDEPNQYGIKWTAGKFLKVISDYSRGKKYKIDNPDLINGDGRPSLVAFKNASGYSFDYDLPLNGNWSDLTLQFEFQKRSEDFAVILHDVHTL